MEVTSLSDEEQAKLRSAVEPVIEKFSNNIGPDLIAQAREDMAKAKSQ